MCFFKVTLSRKTAESEIYVLQNVPSYGHFIHTYIYLIIY
jgi:hypothetical protein